MSATTSTTVPLSRKWCSKYKAPEVEEIEYYAEPCDLCLWKENVQAYECDPKTHSVYLYPRVYYVLDK